MLIIHKLFEKHAFIYNISVIDAIKKWLPKYDMVFGEEAKTLHMLLTQLEWEWLGWDWKCLYPSEI